MPDTSLSLVRAPKVINLYYYQYPQVTFKNDCGDNSVCDVDLSVTGQLGYSGYSSDFAGIVVNGTKVD